MGTLPIARSTETDYLVGIDTGQRHVRCQGLFEVRGWVFKLYGMGRSPAGPSSQLVETAKELITSTVPSPARTETRQGLGFVTVHAGEDGDYVLIDWWQSDDLLHHHLFGAAHPHDGRLHYGWPRGVACCIWELAVAWFERNAWWRHVLSKPENPDFEAYLADRMEGTV